MIQLIGLIADLLGLGLGIFLFFYVRWLDRTHDERMRLKAIVELIGRVDRAMALSAAGGCPYPGPVFWKH